MSASNDCRATLTDRITGVPDFPRSGISFKDLSGILADPASFRCVVQWWAQNVAHLAASKVVGVEARGFPWAAALSYELGCGFIPLRKPNKLPRRVFRQDYELEYGRSTLEIHCDDVRAEDRVIVVDDVLATGGTAAAAVDLVRKSGAKVELLAVVMDLPFLGGRQAIAAKGVRSLVAVDDEGRPYTQ